MCMRIGAKVRFGMRTHDTCVRMYVRAEDGLGAGEPCDVACADEIWRALIELGSPSTVLSRCVSCFSSFELPPMPGSSLIVVEQL